jgi:MFS family permease
VNSELRAVFRNRDAIRFMFARLTANVAAQIQTIAVGWQVYSVTHNALDLGLIGLSQFLPFVLLILPAGHVADRLDRRRIVFACYVLQLTCAVGLFVCSLRGLTTPWPVFSLMVLFGTARAFAMPTAQAMLPNLVPKELFSRAVALNSMTLQMATVFGPTLGGVLYLAGPRVAYLVVMALFVVAMTSMWSISRPVKAATSNEPPGWATLLKGLQFVRSRRTVLGAISLDLFAVLFGGATALLPAFARDILHVGPSGLGMLRTSTGIGAALCAIWLSAHPIRKHAGRWMFGGVAVFGFAILTFSLTTNFWIAALALMFSGAGDMVSVYIRHLLVQLETPDEIRGRVSAVNAVFIGASNELGEFESGLTAGWWGLTRSVTIGAGLTLGVAAMWARLFPELWKMNEPPQPVAERVADSGQRTADSQR